MSSDRIEIRRDELFSPEVDTALARSRALRSREAPPSPPVSPLRRLLMNPLFYLPLAGAAGAILVWLIIEPSFNDFSIVGGEVVLVNTEPFDVTDGISLTVGDVEVVAVPGKTVLEPGADGQPALASVDEIRSGDMIEASGKQSSPKRVIAFGLRPATRAHATLTGQSHLDAEVGWAQVLLFPMTAAALALFLTFFEGFTTRNWMRMLHRCFLGTLLAVVFAFVAFVPAGLLLSIGQAALDRAAANRFFVTASTLPAGTFLLFTVVRSGAWACIGAALGLGMNLVRSTRTQLRNSVFGGAIGGALGGLFFDPIDRFLSSGSLFREGDVSRAVGLVAVGIGVGVFVALVERLAREAWVRVRTGPLAGKSFVLYKSPTVIGSAPESDIYLFKDAEIDGRHLAIHRVGIVYEAEDQGSRHGTLIGSDRVHRRRLVSGDTITVGSTVLEFEERARRTAIGAEA